MARGIGGKVLIIVKGRHDVISDGSETILCDALGSPRRAGGQGWGFRVQGSGFRVQGSGFRALVACDALGSPRRAGGQGLLLLYHAQA